MQEAIQSIALRTGHWTKILLLASCCEGVEIYHDINITSESKQCCSLKYYKDLTLESFYLDIESFDLVSYNSQSHLWKLLKINWGVKSTWSLGMEANLGMLRWVLLTSSLLFMIGFNEKKNVVGSRHEFLTWIVQDRFASS